MRKESKVKESPTLPSVVDAIGKAALDARAVLAELHAATRDARVAEKALRTAYKAIEDRLASVPAEVGAAEQAIVDNIVSRVVHQARTEISAGAIPLMPLGLAEVAERLGRARATVDGWRQNDLLPPPDGTVGGRPAWWAETIDTWAESTGRLV